MCMGLGHYRLSSVGAYNTIGAVMKCQTQAVLGVTFQNVGKAR